MLALARAVLEAEESPGAPLEGGHIQAPDGVADADLLEQVRRHRLAPLLAPYADALGLSPGVSEALRDWRVRARPHLLVQTLTTARLATELADRDVPVLVVKGAALAAQTTGRPDARGPGDVDLLVRPRDVAAVHDLLTGPGWSLQAPAGLRRDTWAWRHLVRWGNELSYAAGPAAAAGAVPVDLHWRLDLVPGVHPPFERLWERRASVDVGGTVVATLAPADALRHLAVHGELPDLLSKHVDVRRLARLVDEPDRRAPVVREALALVDSTVGLPDGVGAAGVTGGAAATTEAARPAAGRGTHAGRRLRQVRSPRDLAHVLVCTLLPVDVVEAVSGRRAWPALGVALWRSISGWARGRRRRV